MSNLLFLWYELQIPRCPRDDKSKYFCFPLNIDACAYLNFSVVSAKSANTSDAIQKRTMIFDSDHPSNSK
jgi:hypothetical protein